MGSLTRLRARNRLQIALKQRLATADTSAARRAVYQDVVDCLARIAIDEAELDRVARDVAVAPAANPFPDTPVGKADPNAPDLSSPDGGGR